MQAAIYARYGDPDVVQIADVEKPGPNDDEVLLKVRAASVNPYDWHLMRGLPQLMRLMSGLRQPKETRLGVDVAGEVEAVGSNVTQFRPGDAVFGTCTGAFAEYVCAPQSALAAKPGNVSFEQAATAGIAALTALQALRDKGRIQAGQKVLVNGAAGGVGTFAVQIAKAFGAEVTGVCSAKNLDLVRSIGADHVVDYAREDFTQGGQRYDLIFDCVGNHSLRALTRALVSKGRYVGAGGGGITPDDFSGVRWMAAFLGRSLMQRVLPLFVSQRLTGILAQRRKEDLNVLRDLMAAGKIVPLIGRRYPLTAVREAIRYLEQGHARGKVVIAL